MVSNGNGATAVAGGGGEAGDRPTAAEVASGGLGDSRTTRRILSAVVRDVLSGDLAERRGGVAVNAIGKALTVVRMEHAYGGTFEIDPDCDPAAVARQREVEALKRRLAELGGN